MAPNLDGFSDPGSDDEKAGDQDGMSPRKDLEHCEYNDTIKELARSTSVSYEDLNLLLFMTQKSIGDLKSLQKFYRIKKQNMDHFSPQKWGNYVYYGDLDADLKLRLKNLSLNPINLNMNFKKMISNTQRVEYDRT